MFSLVQYDNEEYYIVPSKHVTIIQDDDCLVKFKGSKYCATLMKKSDSKKELHKIQQNLESELLLLIETDNKTIADNERINNTYEVTGTGSSTPMNQESLVPGEEIIDCSAITNRSAESSACPSGYTNIVDIVGEHWIESFAKSNELEDVQRLKHGNSCLLNPQIYTPIYNSVEEKRCGDQDAFKQRGQNKKLDEYERPIDNRKLDASDENNNENVHKYEENDNKKQDDREEKIQKKLNNQEEQDCEKQDDRKENIKKKLNNREEQDDEKRDDCDKNIKTTLDNREEQDDEKRDDREENIKKKLNNRKEQDDEKRDDCDKNIKTTLDNREEQDDEKRDDREENIKKKLNNQEKQNDEKRDDREINIKKKLNNQEEQDDIKLDEHEEQDNNTILDDEEQDDPEELDDMTGLDEDKEDHEDEKDEHEKKDDGYNVEYDSDDIAKDSDYIPNQSSLDRTSLRSRADLTKTFNRSYTKCPPVDIRSINVPCSKDLTSNTCKKYFCPYCKTLQTKFARHLELKHTSEADVKEFIKFPKGNHERAKIIESIRKQGNFLHNTNSDLNTGILITCRRRQPKFNHSAEDYICCSSCKGFFSRRTLRLHSVKCDKKHEKGVRDLTVMGRRVTGYIHELANDVLRRIVFPVMRDDEITRSIKYDELIILFGNKLCDKYTDPHQHDMICAQLRLLGRFKCAIIKD